MSSLFSVVSLSRKNGVFMPLLSIFISTKETPEWVATEKHFYKIVLFHVTLKDFFCICVYLLQYKVSTQYSGFVESLQSHYIHTMSHWSRGLPVCFPSWGSQIQIPRGILMWNRDSPVSVVLPHWRPRRDSITGFVALQWVLHQAPRRQCASQRLCQPSVGASLGFAQKCVSWLDLTKLFCPGFMLADGPPSDFTTDGVGYWGEPCGEPAISLHSHHV